MEGGESIRVSETDCVTCSFGCIFLGFLVVLMGFLVVLVVYFWIDFLCKFWLLSTRQIVLLLVIVLFLCFEPIFCGSKEKKEKKRALGSAQSSESQTINPLASVNSLLRGK